MAKKKEVEGIMGFFGVNKPLFVERELTGDNIERFVDREELLARFKSAIQFKKTCAITGKEGSGKSSFLLKLMAEMKRAMYCDYLQFSFPSNEFDKSRLHFLRAILHSILYLIDRNDALLALFDKDQIAFEKKRLEYSITIENQVRKQANVDGEISGGIKNDFFKMMLPFDVAGKVATSRSKEEGKGETIDYPVHNENTLYESITKISQELMNPIVLFIDELDKIGRFPLETPEWDRELIKILELSREIMANDKLIMVFSLQDELYQKLLKAKQGKEGGSVIGLINYFKRLGGFDWEFAKSAVIQSLKVSGYPGAIGDLFEKGVLEIVLDVVKGNPRLFMTYLSELCIEAYQDNQHIIALDLLKEYLFELFEEEMTEDRWQELLKKAA
ncbi:MAG: AAA family ATPase [Candidatus Aminicenantes bacterium]|nr:AAA family ATPase [Candidatus Aminicenantes bacterium]